MPSSTDLGKSPLGKEDGNAKAMSSRKELDLWVIAEKIYIERKKDREEEKDAREIKKRKAHKINQCQGDSTVEWLNNTCMLFHIVYH